MQLFHCAFSVNHLSAYCIPLTHPLDRPTNISTPHSHSHPTCLPLTLTLIPHVYPSLSLSLHMSTPHSHSSCPTRLTPLQAVLEGNLQKEVEHITKETMAKSVSWYSKPCGLWPTLATYECYIASSYVAQFLHQTVMLAMICCVCDDQHYTHT